VAVLLKAESIRLGGSRWAALVDAKHPVIVHAEAFGNGQDYGHVPSMLEGAKAHA
jgi:hypothetical protein